MNFSMNSVHQNHDHCDHLLLFDDCEYRDPLSLHFFFFFTPRSFQPLFFATPKPYCVSDVFADFPISSRQIPG